MTPAFLGLSTSASTFNTYYLGVTFQLFVPSIRKCQPELTNKWEQVTFEHKVTSLAFTGDRDSNFKIQSLGT